MKKTIAFSGSNSSTSINGKLINYATTLLDNVEVISLTDYEVPIFGVDLEKATGIPEGTQELMKKIQKADRVLVSTPEHNALMPAFFKNILDWLSRTGVKYLEGKPTVVMSASPGRGGAKNAAKYVEKMLGYAGADVTGRFSLHQFNENFDVSAGKISDPELDALLRAALNSF